jgi:TctA family transporter
MKLGVTSGFGPNRGAFVTLDMDGKDILQMSIEEARHHAIAVLEAAEAAEMDGVIVSFAEKLGVPSGSPTAAMLLEFRKLRDANRRRRQGVV